MINQINRPWRSGGIFLAVSALLMGLLALINYQRGPAQAAGLNSGVGKDRPITLRGRLLGGGKLSTAKWKGKVIVVDFWGTWCPWCLKEAPYIEKLYSQYHGHGLEVLGIPVLSPAASVNSYRKAHPKESWPQIFNENPGNGALAQKLGIRGFPTEFVIDRRGILRHIIVGYDPHQLAADVQKLLAGKGH
ncbi:MAG: TlpA disulfide reductase family protein [Phycisphaerae bacterium]